jgi:hypothetical protein
MKVSVSPGHNINGTLIMPIFEGTDSVPDSHAEGMHTALKSQVNMVLGEGDFKGKAKSTMSLVGTEGGKAMLVGLGRKKMQMFTPIERLVQLLLPVERSPLVPNSPFGFLVHLSIAWVPSQKA